MFKLTWLQFSAVNSVDNILLMVMLTKSHLMTTLVAKSKGRKGRMQQ